jgi:hypothetical protein
MKDLERRLVEILVDQQKKLLSVIKKAKDLSKATAEEDKSIASTQGGGDEAGEAKE